MSQLKKMSIILVIAFVATILESTEAADHIVGGSTGWTSSAGATFYSDWASNITFNQNDVLVFNFIAGGHNVAETSKANFDNCNVNQISNAITTSPARVTLSRTGDFYFTCTVPNHCQSGQKLSIKVSTSSSGNTPTSPTSGGTPSPSSPTQPGATPPSPGSATALVATFPALFVVLVILLL